MLISSLCIITACSKEGFISLSISPQAKAFIPNFNNAILYVSDAGDTIALSRVSQNTYYDKSYDLPPTANYIGTVDYIELERLRAVIVSDTFDIEIHIDISTRYDANTATYSADNITYTLIEDSSITVQTLNLMYTDTTSCATANCMYQDSLILANRVFLNVFSNPPTTPIGPALFVNNTNGIIGFRTRDNKTYELI